MSPTPGVTNYYHDNNLQVGKERFSFIVMALSKAWVHFADYYSFINNNMLYLYIYSARSCPKRFTVLFTILLSLNQTCFHPAHISTPKGEGSIQHMLPL